MGTFFFKHFAKLLAVPPDVLIFLHNVLKMTASGLRTLDLLLRGIPEYEHRRWEHIGRQMQKFPVRFAVFHDVSDVTGPNAKALGRGDGVLRRNVGIRYRKQEIAHAWLTRFAAAFRKNIIPLLKIGAENENHFPLCDERLVVTADGQLLLQFLIRDV